MNRSLFILFILLILALALPLAAIAHSGSSQSAQLVSLPIPPAITNYLVVFAFDGTNLSAPSNEIAVTQPGVELAWDPSPSPDVVYVIGSRRINQHFYRLESVGTNTSAIWPAPQSPVIITAWCGGQPFYCATNPAGTRFFKSMPTSAPNIMTVSDSTDLVNWTNPFAIIKTTNSDLTITR